MFQGYDRKFLESTGMFDSKAEMSGRFHHECNSIFIVYTHWLDPPPGCKRGK